MSSRCRRVEEVDSRSAASSSRRRPKQRRTKTKPQQQRKPSAEPADTVVVNSQSEHSGHEEEPECDMGRWKRDVQVPPSVDTGCRRCDGEYYLYGSDRSSYCLSCLEETETILNHGPPSPTEHPAPTEIFSDAELPGAPPDPLQDADPWRALQPVNIPLPAPAPSAPRLLELDPSFLQEVVDIFHVTHLACQERVADFTLDSFPMDGPVTVADPLAVQAWLKGRPISFLLEGMADHSAPDTVIVVKAPGPAQQRVNAFVQDLLRQWEERRAGGFDCGERTPRLMEAVAAHAGAPPAPYRLGASHCGALCLRHGSGSQASRGRTGKRVGRQAFTFLDHSPATSEENR